jgi:hypothetical protein
MFKGHKKKGVEEEENTINTFLFTLLSNLTL